MKDQLNTSLNSSQNKDSNFPLRELNGNLYLPRKGEADISIEALEQDFNTLEQQTHAVITEEEIIELSNSEFAYDIWKFSVERSKGDDKRYYISFAGLYRAGSLKYLQAQGYYKRYNGKECFFIKEQASIIDGVNTTLIKDELCNYIYANRQPFIIQYKGAELTLLFEKREETFLNQCHLITNGSFLEYLANHEKPLLKDNENTTRFFFKNGIVEVNGSGTQLISYNELKEYCIWKDQMIAHDIALNSDYWDCHFARFIQNITNKEGDRILAFRTAMGYLTNNHNSPSQGQAVILYDETITDISKPQGGTGKGIFNQAIKQVRSVIKIDGKKYSPTNRFTFQNITLYTQLIFIDDVHPKFNIDSLNSQLTDGFTAEGKFIKEIIFTPEESPKVLISSNTILSNEGTTRKRRQFNLELSDHYSSKIKDGTEEPIIEEHGGKFFSKDWDENEWNQFFNFMIGCSQVYHQKGLVPYTAKNISHNKLKQDTCEDFYEWVMEQEFIPNTEYETKKLFEAFKSTYFPDDNSLHQRSFSNWLKKYGDIFHNWKFKSKSKNKVQYFKFESSG